LSENAPENVAGTLARTPASLIPYGAALLCFFLPFVSLSCQGQRIHTLTGIQLVTGTEIERTGPFGEKTAQRVRPEFPAIVGLIAGIWGLGLARRLRSRLKTIPGIVGLVGLLWLKAKIEADWLIVS
jgi:hypothetical protein